MSASSFRSFDTRPAGYRSVVSRELAVPRVGVGLGAAAGTLLATMGSALVGELIWTGRRPLPTQVPPPSLVHSFPGRGVAGGCDESSSEPTSPLLVVALGDSTLTGPGLERCNEIWLPTALSMAGVAAPIHYVSLAVGGSRVADAARRATDALRLTPDLVVVAVGANDALHGVPVHRIRRRLDGLLTSLLPHVGVVAVTNIGDLGNIARVPAPLSSLLRLRARRVRRAIEQVVALHDDAVLLDVTTADVAFRDRSIFTPDLFHPGTQGHAAWARAVVPQLRMALERAHAR